MDGLPVRLQSHEPVRSTADDQAESAFPGRALFLVYECPNCNPSLGFDPVISLAEDGADQPICQSVRVRFAPGYAARAIASADEILAAFESGEVALGSTDETWRCDVEPDETAVKPPVHID